MLLLKKDLFFLQYDFSGVLLGKEITYIATETSMIINPIVKYKFCNE